MKRGDERAFTFLLETYADRVVNYVYHFVRDRETAKELTQDVFMKLWVSRAALDESASFEAYLFTIARNHLFNHLKRRLREQAIIKEMGKAATEAVPADGYDYQETLHTYRSTLEGLPTQQKRAFILSREEGLSYRQIAVELGISVSAVEKHIMAALSAMRKNLHPICLAALIYLQYK